jgi:hypothetical protein
MATEKKPVEQRQCKRFRVRSEVVVLLSPHDAEMGQLRDVSMGGLTFDFVTSQVLPIEATRLDICPMGSAFLLCDLPFRSIWELSIYETKPTSLHRKRCGVQFGELTPDQIRLLEYFINNYTTGETA